MEVTYQQLRFFLKIMPFWVGRVRYKNGCERYFLTFTKEDAERWAISTSDKNQADF